MIFSWAAGRLLRAGVLLRDATGWTTAVIGSWRKKAAAGGRGRVGARAFCLRDRRAAIAAWSCVGFVAAFACAVTFRDRDLAAHLDLAAVRYAKK